MPQLIKEQDFQYDTAAGQRHNAKQRARLKASLPTIATEVTAALHDASIAMSVFFTVPSSGPILTFATPTDPDDQMWNRVREIVVPIVSRVVRLGDLICQEAPCASAGVMMAAADLLEDSDSFNMNY
jgi:hypothetical protein